MLREVSLDKKGRVGKKIYRTRRKSVKIMETDR